MKGPAPKLHSYQGKSLSLRAWAKATGFSYACLQSRLRYGYSLEKALTIPLHTKPKQLVVVVSAEQVLRSWGVMSHD